MLIQFSVKNFRSIKDQVTLSLEAESLKTNKSATIKAGNNSLLPSAAIFGKNASGKSNLFRAIELMKWGIGNQNVLGQPLTEHPLLQSFALDKRTQKKPSHFEIVVWDSQHNSEYRYGFELSGEAVESEWLEITSRVEKNYRSRMVFTREKQVFGFVGKDSEKELKPLAGRVIPQALAVSVFAQFNAVHALRLVNIVNSIVLVDGTVDATPVALNRCSNDPNYSKKLLKFLKQADLGISGLNVESIFVDSRDVPNLPPQLLSIIPPQGAKLEQVKINTRHKIHDSDGYVDFELTNQESLGTRKLFGLGAIIIDALDAGSTVVVDEFGSSLHPFISQALAVLFNSKETNPRGAQLIMFTHETYLLSRKTGLRRDQIWFTDKGDLEETELRSLAEFKTRNDYEIAKNYLEGRFGALPALEFDK